MQNNENDKTPQLMLVTPEWATEKLNQLEAAEKAGTIKQRNVSGALVDKIANDILAGHWITNHQAIALAGPEEILIDGQHRLWAVTQSNKAVNMYVSRGWNIEDSANGITVMDTIDTGKSRNTANILTMRGFKHVNNLVGMINSIGKIISGSSRSAMSPAQVVEALKMYQPHFQDLLSVANGHTSFMPSYICGPLVMYYKAFPRKGRQLAMDFFFMEDLRKGHPVLCWHRWKQTARGGGSEVTWLNIQRVCNAIRCFDADEDMNEFRPSKDAREWLANQDKPTKSQMKEILGLV